MTTTHDLTQQHRNHILSTPHILRVGIMAPVDEAKKIILDPRWTESLEERGFEVIRIPVKPLDDREIENIHKILDHLDGLLMPGGDSNVHPSMYKPYVTHSDDLHDEVRDLYAVELLKRAYDIDLPTLAICRGFQEMVVTFGGDLIKLDTEGDINHAKNYSAPVIDGRRCHKALDEPVHSIQILPGGHLAAIFGEQSIMVNSTHYEGTKTLKGRLVDEFCIEARAPDDVIEGISAKNKTFYLGLQPHYELRGRGRTQHDGVFNRFDHHIRARHDTRLLVLNLAHGADNKAELEQPA